MSMQKVSQEIKDFAVEMMEHGHSSSYIKTVLEEDFGVIIKRWDTLDRWFITSRSNLYKRSDESSDRYEHNYQDAMNFNKRVAKLKEHAKPGLILVYMGEVPGQNEKPIPGERQSLIKRVYRNYILTEDGAIQFNDAKGVINFG